MRQGSQVHGKACPWERHRCTACSFCRGAHTIFSYKILMQSAHPRAHTLLGPNPHCSGPRAAAQHPRHALPWQQRSRTGDGSQSKGFPPQPRVWDAEDDECKELC